MPAPTQSELPAVEIEYNLNPEMTGREIGEARDNATVEVWQLLTGNLEQEPPFGEPIINTKEETEPRQTLLARQLEISLRYLDELLEIDDEICGRAPTSLSKLEWQRTSPVKIKLIECKQRGKRATIIANNIWGSTDYNDSALQAELKQLMEAVGCNQAEFEEVLSEFLERTPATGYDLQLLSEDDKADIFDEQGENMGTATVLEARGKLLQLKLEGAVKLKKGWYLNKRSNRKNLEIYKSHVIRYSAKLNLLPHLKDNHGNPYPHKADALRATLKGRLSLPERVFFGVGNNDAAISDRWYEDDDFIEEDIPRQLCGDNEQSVAFALGALRHPCHLIHGPPGTGKTTVARHLVQYFEKQGLRVLIASHSNRGLDVLLKAIKDAGVTVHRGGTEIGSCHHTLREQFIRRGLKAPKRADFFEDELEEIEYEAALAEYRAGGGGSAPQEADFKTRRFDEYGWDRAWDQFESKKERIIRDLQNERSMVAGVTLNSFISDEIIQALGFDVIIVDEASKGYIFELLPVLEAAGIMIIFIGDHKQLKNNPLPLGIQNIMVDKKNSYAADKNNKVIKPEDVAKFANGPFELLAENTAIPQIMLATNRRSLAGIILDHNYDGNIKAGRLDETDPSNPGVLQWIDTAGRPHRFETPVGVSKVNHLEARIIAKQLVEAFLANELTATNFGVISMYSAQRKLIIEKIQQYPFKNDRDREILLALLHGNNGTVDSFQGSQRRQIWLSLTRSNQDDKIGHISDTNRINVALSRAQDKLVIVGDSTAMIDNNTDPDSRAFYEAAMARIKKHGRVIRQSHNARRNQWRRRQKLTLSPASAKASSGKQTQDDMEN